MHFTTFVVASLPVLGAFAAPHWSEWHHTSHTTTTGVSTTKCTTSTTAVTTTKCTSSTTVKSSTTSSSTAPISTPTSAYGLISARSASPVHLLPFNAAGQRFYLGGGTASYCPDSVRQAGDCPPGTYTAFLGTCAMDVLVPGGQQIYVTPEGEIGFTQAHSISIPPGANVCPFSYSKPAGSSFGYVSLNPAIAFGATGFMACPTDNAGIYQVFANLKNAKVPKGNVADCLGFDALSSDYSGIAAWQYT